MDARHFPVARRRVLAGRGERAFPESRDGIGGRRKTRKRLDIRESPTAQIRQLQRTLAREVTERVAAHIPIGGGNRHFADTDTIDNNPHDSLKCHAIKNIRSVRPVLVPAGVAWAQACCAAAEARAARRPPVHPCRVRGPRGCRGCAPSTDRRREAVGQKAVHTARHTALLIQNDDSSEYFATLSVRASPVSEIDGAAPLHGFKEKGETTL